jgi:hypothetical protein
MKIFKIEYQWYEGDYDKTLLGKDVSSEEFEKDLIKAKEFAESLIGKEINEDEYLGKGYKIECLPEFYEQIIYFLKTKLNYVECDYDKDIKYAIEDNSDKKILLSKSVKKVEWVDIKC